jgi:hypothetical protein
MVRIMTFNMALNALTNVGTTTDFSVADETIQTENGIFMALLPRHAGRLGV